MLRSKNNQKTHENPALQLVRRRMNQKNPARPGSTICYCQDLARKSHRGPAVWFVTVKNKPERATKTRQYDLFTTNRKQKESPRQYDLLQPRMGKKEKPRPRNDLLRLRMGDKQPMDQKKPSRPGSARPGSAICRVQERTSKSYQNPGVRFVTARNGPEKQYDLLRPFFG